MYVDNNKARGKDFKAGIRLEIEKHFCRAWNTQTEAINFINLEIARIQFIFSPRLMFACSKCCSFWHTHSLLVCYLFWNSELPEILHVQCLHFSFFAPFFRLFVYLKSILQCIFSCKILTKPTLANWENEQRWDGLNEVNCLVFSMVCDGQKHLYMFYKLFCGILSIKCLFVCLSVV